VFKKSRKWILMKHFRWLISLDQPKLFVQKQTAELLASLFVFRQYIQHTARLGRYFKHSGIFPAFISPPTRTASLFISSCPSGNRLYGCHSEESRRRRTTKNLIFTGSAEILRGVYPACPALSSGERVEGLRMTWRSFRMEASSSFLRHKAHSLKRVEGEHRRTSTHDEFKRQALTPQNRRGLACYGHNRRGMHRGGGKKHQPDRCIYSLFY